MVRRVRRVVVKVDLGREKSVVVVVVRVARVWPGVVGVWERLMVRSLVRWISVAMVFFGVVVMMMLLVDGSVLDVVGCGCLWDGP